MNNTNWYKVYFKVCTGIECFRYNKRVKHFEKGTQFINTETHEIVAIWDWRIIKFEAE